MLKILLIDDTRSVHSYVKALLSKIERVEVVSAFDGQEGIEIVKNEEPFDLILLDWEMPVKTGPETLRELMEINCPIPVMMMTTKNAPEDIQRMLELGASEYLMKPFTVDILTEKIEQLIGRGIGHVA